MPNAKIKVVHRPEGTIHKKLEATSFPKISSNLQILGTRGMI